MIDHLMTEQELGLLIELLETERRQLLPEIRHTDARAMKEDLRDRLRTIERLIDRFQQVQAGHPAPPP